jgi:hypothetical protein
MTTLDQYPQRDGLYRVLPEGVAVHNRYQDRVIVLDNLGSEIWLRADGITTLRDIAGDIAGMCGASTESICRAAAILVVILNSEGILYSKNEPDDLPYHLRFPQEEQDADQMAASMAAAGWLDKK